jgi:hypothetical protein
MLRQNHDRINRKWIPPHHLPKRSPEQTDILGFAQKLLSMVRHHRKKIGVARNPCSAVLHYYVFGFRASTQATIL